MWRQIEPFHKVEKSRGISKPTLLVKFELE